jgi:uncharacterized damage-inducible protein DinB
MPKPLPGTFQPYAATYINQVQEDHLPQAFKAQHALLNEFFESIPPEKENYAYAPGKWTLKQMLQHIIDAERIFAYRALCIARGETLDLPGFEENDYAANSHASNRNWKELVEELRAVRRTTEILFNSFTEEAVMNKGLANNFPVTPHSLGFILIGHLYHHVTVIKERYILA